MMKIMAQEKLTEEDGDRVSQDSKLQEKGSQSAEDKWISPRLHNVVGDRAVVIVDTGRPGKIHGPRTEPGDVSSSWWGWDVCKKESRAKHKIHDNQIPCLSARKRNAKNANFSPSTVQRTPFDAFFRQIAS
jgi:hypothetical protein